MDLLMVFFLAVGLSMDAFAVSVTNGMSCRMPTLKNALYSGAAFGLFQGMMPLAGYLAGYSFAGVVERYDHWVALILLGVIGGRMILEAARGMKSPEDFSGRKFSFKTLVVQAFATSVDALAVGVSLGFMSVNVYAAVGMIAATTFLFSFAGVIIGNSFGRLLKEKAEAFGGIILIAIGIKIFIEHTGILEGFLFF